MTAGLWNAARSGLFEALAKETHYMGDSGAGATTKLVVNTLLGVNMQALAEAVALGVASGLDRDKLLDVLATTATIGDAHRPKIENIRKDDYPSQFDVRLMHKDFGLISAQAQRAGAVMPATAACARIDSPHDDLALPMEVDLTSTPCRTSPAPGTRLARRRLRRAGSR